jgi:hypothetical protein
MIIKTKHQDIDITDWELDRVFGITAKWDNVIFEENCEWYYYIEMPKEEAIKTLEYFIEFIKTN